MIKLGDAAKAREEFEALREGAMETLKAGVAAQAGEPYTATIARRAGLAVVHYAAALADFGLGGEADARKELALALDASPQHAGARALMRSMENRTVGSR
jgi:hypothetical protein